MSPTRPQTCPPMSRFSYKGNMHGNTSQGTSQSILKSPCHHPEGNRASDNQEKIYVKIGTVSTADGRKIDSCVQKRQSAQDMMEPNNPRHVAFRSDLLNDGNHGPDQKVCSFHYPNPSNPKVKLRIKRREFCGIM